MIKIPLPRGTRYRYRTINPRRRQRLAFRRGTNQVVEVTNYIKRNGTWVENHTRRFPRKIRR